MSVSEVSGLTNILSREHAPAGAAFLSGGISGWPARQDGQRQPDIRNAGMRRRNYFMSGGMQFMDRKLYRSDDNRLICGVCGGLGEFFNIDPTIVRLVFAVLSVFGGSGIGLYLLAVFIIPKRS